MSATHRARRGLTGEKLTGGEVTGDEIGTNVFTILFRTYMYPWLAWRITEATLSVSMAARRWCAVADSLSPVKM